MRQVIRKTLFSAIISLIATGLYGQSFMRYKMKDGSFNGFYTNYVDSISHTVENGTAVQKVYSGENVRIIPIEDIEDISFESAALNPDEYAGEYRLYELDAADQEFKKILVDNRAFCMASKNGDFGANDTVFVVSVYNDVHTIFFTDSDGRVTRYFDGENYLLLDYKNDGTVDVVDFTEDGAVTIKKKKAALNRRRTLGYYKKEWICFKTLAEFKKDQTFSKRIDAILMFTDILANIDSDPELHNQRVIKGWLDIAGDLVGIGASVGTIAPSGGLTSYLVGLQVANLCLDGLNLWREIFPDAETMAKYKAFYADKYGINVSTLPAVEVKATSARLKGLISNRDGMRGYLFFCLDCQKNESYFEIAPASYEKENGIYQAEAEVSALTPDEIYRYWLAYQCKVDGLDFRYLAECEVFTTLKPVAIAGNAYEVTDETASIDCEFMNAEGLWCGLNYSAELANGGTVNGVIAAESGKQIVKMSGLEPYTTYSYYPIIRCDNKDFIGESQTFTTALPDISGSWSVTEEYDVKVAGVWETRTRTYSLTLKQDGSFLKSGGNYLSSRWSYSGTGTLSAYGHIVANQTQMTWERFEGQVDDVRHPTVFTGSRYIGNSNQVTSVEECKGKFVARK